MNDCAAASVDMTNDPRDRGTLETKKANCSEARKRLAERTSALVKSPAFSSQDEQMEAHIVRIRSAMDVINRVSNAETRPR
jgi:hypothetical protein